MRFQTRQLSLDFYKSNWVEIQYFIYTAYNHILK